MMMMMTMMMTTNRGKALRAHGNNK